jgi:hypothetical protein
MRAVGAGRTFPDAHARARALVALVEGRTSAVASQEALAPYDRRTIARCFAELLDQIARP